MVFDITYTKLLVTASSHEQKTVFSVPPTHLFVINDHVHISPNTTHLPSKGTSQPASPISV